MPSAIAVAPCRKVLSRIEVVSVSHGIPRSGFGILALRGHGMHGWQVPRQPEILRNFNDINADAATNAQAV
jgi:hypothetical protein